MGPGHPRKTPGFTENVPPALQEAYEVRCIRQAYLDSMQAMEVALERLVEVLWKCLIVVETDDSE
jgi:hypothetical protein